jgi:hypothetical protein
MLIYDALVLAEVAARLARKRRCLLLGVPTLTFSPGALSSHLTGNWDVRDANGFFSRLGFEEVDALDVSAYEGANIIADLNDPSLPKHIDGDYDLIYDSGTLEHIFDAPTALRSLVSLTSKGGVIVHANPANGFMDHGLWQISPDLFRAFYGAAGYDILTSALFVLGSDWYALPATQNLYRTKGRKHIVTEAPEAIVVFAAMKRETITAPITVQLQEYYSQMHVGDIEAIKTCAFFIEFDRRRARVAPNQQRLFRRVLRSTYRGAVGALRTFAQRSR